MGPAQLTGAQVPLPPKNFFVNRTIPWHVTAHFFILAVEADGRTRPASVIASSTGFQHSRHARLGVHDDLRSLAASLFIDIFIGLGIHPQRKLPHEVQHVRIRSLDSLKEAVGNEALKRLLK